MANVPLEPEECLELTWSLMFLFSDNEQGRKLGQDVQNRINKLIETEQDPNNKSYLSEITNAILGTTRVLAYRAAGMRQYIQLFNKIEEKRIDELNNLATITDRPASLVPRVMSAITGGALGSLSLPEILKKAANYVIPQFGPLSGYELLIIFIILGSSIGYTAIELLLRLYRMHALPRILVETQNEKSTAWNRYVRECREAMRNLLLYAIKTREKYFPNLPTYDKKKFFVETNNISIDDMQRFSCILNSVIRSKGPQVRNQILLKSKLLGKSRSSGIWRFRINKGDVISGSLASALYKKFSFYYYEITNEDIDPTIDKVIYKREGIFADEFNFVSKSDGWGVLLFKNNSFLRSTLVSFSCEIIRYDIHRFCV